MVSPRTNNHIKGYNNKLKKFVRAAKPNIFKMVEILKAEETNSDKKFRKAPTVPLSKLPHRGNYYSDKDSKLKVFKDFLSNRSITLDVYWQSDNPKLKKTKIV